MKDHKTLKTLLIVILGVSAIKSFNYGAQLISTIINKPDNPLIPDFLWKYAAFPLTILTLFFLIIALYALYSLTKKVYKPLAIYFVLLTLIGCTLWAPKVFQFINSFNPYA